jgi:hypothetical protein
VCDVNAQIIRPISVTSDLNGNLTYPRRTKNGSTALMGMSMKPFLQLELQFICQQQAGNFKLIIVNKPIENQFSGDTRKISAAPMLEVSTM